MFHYKPSILGNYPHLWKPPYPHFENGQRHQSRNLRAITPTARSFRPCRYQLGTCWNSQFLMAKDGKRWEKMGKKIRKEVIFHGQVEFLKDMKIDELLQWIWWISTEKTDASKCRNCFGTCKKQQASYNQLETKVQRLLWRGHRWSAVPPGVFASHSSCDRPRQGPRIAKEYGQTKPSVPGVLFWIHSNTNIIMVTTITITYNNDNINNAKTRIYHPVI